MDRRAFGLADDICAAGILQAIGNFHFGPNVSPRDIKDFQKCKVNIFSLAYEVVKFYLFYGKAAAKSCGGH
ncbi:putative sucrose-phosphate phosphatase [Rosa chinensis]|uniref:Putative sucrose-phosphate phosphatase n=1 Tax=Rosa chinensis TaxID=74649 RepID=A0A2P6RUU8_ROSCH|nr:putative sucrose-phosphate phosphatase [Rosa chinensis]